MDGRDKTLPCGVCAVTYAPPFQEILVLRTAWHPMVSFPQIIKLINYFCPCVAWEGCHCCKPLREAMCQPLQSLYFLFPGGGGGAEGRSLQPGALEYTNLSSEVPRFCP